MLLAKVERIEWPVFSIVFWVGNAGAYGRNQLAKCFVELVDCWLFAGFLDRIDETDELLFSGRYSLFVRSHSRKVPNYANTILT